MFIFNMAKNKKYILGILISITILVIAGIILFGEPFWERAYFTDNFDTNKKEWNFYHNGESKPAVANIEAVDGNNVLRCVGSYWAKINKEWDDYSLKFRFKRIEGSMTVIFREYRSETENSRYVINLGNDKGTAMSLSKAMHADFQDIERIEFAHYKDWHTLEVRVRDNIINIYLDDDFLIKYKDTENPILSGGVSFSIISNSEFLIDDVEIKSVRKEDVAEEVDCPYECCTDDFYKSKSCSDSYVCYDTVCRSKDEEIELIKDTRFEWGLGEFTESNLPQSQWCKMPVQEKEPAWTVSEIATEAHFCKNLPNPKSTEPTIIFESEGGYKKLTSYKDGRIKLQFDTSAEEKEGCVITNYKRTSPASSWPLYGVKQQIPVDFADFEELNFSLDVKLNKFEPAIYEQKCTKYGAKIDRYGGFGIVFLLKREGEGYGPGNLYWLLIDSCSKHWWSGGSGNKECASNKTEYIMSDDFGIPMYHPVMDDDITSSVNNKHPILEEGQWVSYNVDLKKFAEDGLNYFNAKYGAKLDMADYQLAHIDIAWEIIGAFDTEIELRNFSLKGKLVNN